MVLLWAPTLGSLLLTLVGLVERRPFWLYTAALLFVPMAWYLSLTPRFRYIGWILPLCQVAAASQVRRSRSVAVLLLTPVAGVTAWLGVLVGLSHAGAAAAASDDLGPRLRVTVEAPAGGAAPAENPGPAGSGRPEGAKRPEPTGNEVKVVRRAFSWTTPFFGHGGGTSEGALAMVQRGAVPPVEVAANARLRLLFEPPRPYEVRVRRWHRPGDGLVVLVPAHDLIPVPAEAGLYVFEVAARWPRGDGSWVFAVRVRGE